MLNRRILPEIVLVIGSLGLCLAFQVWLALRLEINWDEFFYLSQIYDFQREEIEQPLQTLHVHLLGWLTAIPGTEVDRIIAGRFVMLSFLTATCWLIYALARTFFGPVASAIAVLAFASAGPTLVHGATFRADPISAFFMMLSLVTLVKGKTSLGTALLAGLSSAIAAMFTIKAGLYAPALLGIAAYRLLETEQWHRILKWLAATALAAILAFSMLYLLQLSLVERSNNAASQSLLINAARTTLIDVDLLPRRMEIIRAAMLSPSQSILIVAGTIGVLFAIFQSKGIERCKLMPAAGGAATLLCLFFYRNAFPYFFPFIMPPAMLLIAWVVDSVRTLKGRIGTGALVTAMLILAAFIVQAWSERYRPPQRQVVAAVHQIFPEPVLMIDHSHMVGSFPKRGFFMSTWGIANYRARPPIFAGILERETVPLLLLDSPRLAEAVGALPERAPSDRLHDYDRAVLRENYISHWGPIWVAGKNLEPSGPRGEFEILIPGSYTLEGDGLTIDDKPVSGGGVVFLARGSHHFEADSQSPRTLRWGNHLRKPLEPEPTGPLFVGF